MIAVFTASLFQACSQDDGWLEEENRQPSANNLKTGTRNIVCNVTTTAIGQLTDKIKEFADTNNCKPEEITELTLSGPVNYSDLKGLRPLAKLSTLDLSQIVVMSDNGEFQMDHLPDSSLDSLSCEAHVLVPTTIVGFGGWVFRNSKIKSVFLPENIEWLNYALFEGCDKLSSIHLSSKIKDISSSAFSNCTSLHEIQLPENLQLISDNAFYKSGLQKINIPENVGTIQWNAFSNCTQLEKVEWNAKATEIPEQCFSNCKKLLFDIPSHITTINWSAFSGCTMSTYNLPEGLVKIGSYAFSNNESLEEITIPSSVTKVEERIVSDCHHLKVVYWESQTPIPILASEWNRNENMLIYAPAGVEYDSRNTNVIRGDEESGYHCDYYELKDGTDFFCPISFTAKQAVYSRWFSQWTYPDESGGWQTIALPFTVTRYVAVATNEQPERELAPFKANAADAKPFWLRELEPSGELISTATLEAGKPYLISMPYNTNYYLPEYNIWGDVQFIGENVQVLTNDQEKSVTGKRYSLHSTFKEIAQSMDIYNIDHDSYYDRINDIRYQGGSVFRSSIRKTEAFEAYITDLDTEYFNPSAPATKTRTIRTLGPIPMDMDK